MTSQPSPLLQTGPYYALVIGEQNYQHVGSLSTRRDDARDVGKLLHDRYGFTTEILIDAKHDQIKSALGYYRKNLPASSNFVIYYAGHGFHDVDADEAYWFPTDAEPDNNEHWISADDITADVRAMPASHVLIISDSCFSGYLTAPRTVHAGITSTQRDALLAKMVNSKSRTLMSSGRDEPVADTGAKGHSIFAAAVLESLAKIEEDNFSATDLFYSFIQPDVGGRSNQLPQYNYILHSGHTSGGDFVFSRRPAIKLLTAGGAETRPARTAKVYRGPGGYWELTDDGWIEHSTANPEVLMRFVELRHDSTYIYLVDHSRVKDNDASNPIMLRLPVGGGTAQWSWSNPLSWNDLTVVTPEP